MEKSKKIDLSNRPKEERDIGGDPPHCPYWIFGNKKSADKDLKNKFEIKDEEDKSNK